MPIIAMTKFGCQTCGRQYDVCVEPIRCACGTKSWADGRIIENIALIRRPADMVAGVGKAVGLHCGGCDGRRKTANRYTAGQSTDAQLTDAQLTDAQD